MKKLTLLLVVFLLHVEASESTQVGTFDAGVSSGKVKIGKKYKAPIEEAKTYEVDINESEIEGITSEPTKPKVQKEELVVIKNGPIKIEKQKSQKSDVFQSEGGGVVLPFDKTDEKTGVVLPMDEEKKGGFFSIFGF
ncbi:MAG TPA: hypothetical protein EYG93_04125 [Sulfurospirillum arcachonense]|nr:hypothetical protein [Sulfurospirillum arcachonense]HIP44507.1 hypothetical protein [Sulfurospirillum arcachonense]